MTSLNLWTWLNSIARIERPNHDFRARVICAAAVTACEATTAEEPDTMLAAAEWVEVLEGANSTSQTFVSPILPFPRSVKVW
jgi:hypothetical protein